MSGVIAASRQTAQSFVSIWKTDNLSDGSSAANQISLPLIPLGTCNIKVDWGDGTISRINDSQDVNRTHTYAVAGQYTITITGQLNNFTFVNAGDKLKLMKITRWGCFRLTTFGYWFNGCENLTLDTVSDILNLRGATDMHAAFSGCSSLTTINRINEWVVDEIESIDSAFRDCFNYNSNMSNWNTPKLRAASLAFANCVKYNQPMPWNMRSLEEMASIFYNCIELNQPISWNTPNCINFYGAFQNCYSFNKPLSLDTSSAISMAAMFVNASSFKQDISYFTISKVTLLYSFMDGIGEYNSAYYDALLISWSMQNPQLNVIAGFGSIKYSAAGAAARNILINTYGWTITDGGQI